jgi:8-oxo-dGTP pyrophosphatase MutT (NUDIX family)
MGRLGGALRAVLCRWIPGLRPPERKTQSGVLPYRMVDGRAEYLLITSRRSKRWLFPKGSLMKDLTPWESAAQEALEEAGIEGVVETTPIGSYPGELNDKRGTPVDIDIYPLRVEIEHKYYHEQAQRRREWVTADEARKQIDDPAKRAIIDAFEARLAQ